MHFTCTARLLLTWQSMSVFFQLWMADYLKQYKFAFEGYVLGTSQATICCDAYMVGTLSPMWNVSITIVLPVYTSPWEIFHHSSKQTIVVLAKWPFIWPSHPSIHYLATQKTLSVAQKVGHNLQDANI